MTRLLAFLFFIISTATMKVHASADSLMRATNSLKGTERLEALRNYMVSRAGMPDHMEYINLLEREARKENNDSMLSFAMAIKVSSFRDIGNIDSMVYYARQAEPLLLETKNYEHYFDSQSLIIIQHISDGDFLLAIDRSQKMLEKAKILNSEDGEITAYETVGIAYLSYRQPAKAIEPFQKALHLLKIKDIRKIYILDIFLYLTSSYIELQQYDEALIYCDSLNNRLTTFEATKAGTRLESLSMNDYLLAAQLSYGSIYLGKEQPELAIRALDKASTYQQGVLETELYTLRFTYAEYYKLIKDYWRALAKVNEVLPYFEHVHPVNYLKALNLKAQTLAVMNKYDEAYQTNCRFMEINDSLAKLNLDKEITQMNIIYETDKKDMQINLQEKELREKSRFIGILGIAVGLLVLIVALTVLYSRSIKAKNRYLYRQIRESDKIKLELKQKREDTLSKETTNPLFELIEKQMNDDKPYLDVEFNRKVFVSLFYSNETYIVNAIKEATGMTPMDYINSFRLEHAKQLLIDSGSQYTIEWISEQSGFASSRNFYRLFKEKYGISPKIFRETALEA